MAGIDPKRRAKLTLPGLPGLEFRLGQDKQAQSACPPSVGEDGVRREWVGCDDIAPLTEAAMRFLADALTDDETGDDGDRPLRGSARRWRTRPVRWRRRGRGIATPRYLRPPGPSGGCSTTGI